MNSICLTCFVFLMCAAIAGIGPENEVAQFWNLLMGGSRGREQVMDRENVLCVVLLTTFLVQDMVPLEFERRLAAILFGPNLFGFLLVLLFCLFDTSVDLYDYLENGEFTKRESAHKAEDLIISATNLVLVIAHIKTFKLRYALQLVADQSRAVSAALAEKEDQCTMLMSGEATLLGRADSGSLKHRPHSPIEKKEL